MQYQNHTPYYKAEVVNGIEIVEAQNKRESHEDAHLVAALPTLGNTSFKDLSPEQKEQFLKKTVSFLEQLLEEEINKSPKYLQFARGSMGATLTLAVLEDKTLHGVNVGDGRIFIATLDAENKIVSGKRINNLHDCYNFSERKRLIKAGANSAWLPPPWSIYFGRMGGLAVTRALVDLDFRKIPKELDNFYGNQIGEDDLDLESKYYGIQKNTTDGDALISEPEYYKELIEIPKGGSAIIIISCDGPFETLYNPRGPIRKLFTSPQHPTDEEIQSVCEQIKSNEEKQFLELLRRAIKNSSSKPNKNLAERISDEVIKSGSEDNITILVKTKKDQEQNQQNEIMLAVFDGHGGKWVAQTAKELLLVALKKAFNTVI